jgi:DUF1680 family protein
MFLMVRFSITLAAMFAVVLLFASYAGAAVNLAPVATPSASYVSGDTSLTALLDGLAPEASHVRSLGSYGNWGKRGTQWVQYDWNRPISTNKIEVFWWDDRGGVRLPESCRLLYWNGKEFTPVENPKGLGVEKDRYNVTTFKEVRTSKLRLELNAKKASSTGILEWRVYDSGKSPQLPPFVTVDCDRSVILGGKTYLNGAFRTVANNDAPITITWSKASGPGNVDFADGTKPTTTATFSAVGDYVLRLTVAQGKLDASATLSVKVVAAPPEKHLELIDTKAYTIDSPLWNSRAKALIVNWIPHCIAKISDPDLSQGGINNFIEAAKKLKGKPHGKHRGHVFSNAWVYNTIESICIAVMVDPKGDKEIIAAQKLMRKTLDDWIPKILAAQESDGYLQTLFTLNDRDHWVPKHRGAHEGYVAGYFLEAGISHYLMSNKTDPRLYNAAKKLADCWCNNIGPSPKKEWFDGHQAMEIALVRFGRFVNVTDGPGKGDKYIELSKFLLDSRKGGNSYDQSHVPVSQQYEAVGHAVRASYSYAGMADVAMETGDPDYHSAVISLYDSMVNRKYYVTGGIGSGETSEGFGPDYSLRHNAYCESCSSCGLIFFQHKLNLTYHDAKFTDLYEESLYNALLGSIDLEGKNFYYQNPLVEKRARYDWHGCPCCVGNIPRTLLMLPTWMYCKDDDSLYVNLFIGSTVTIEDVAGTDVKMVQVTDYPRSGNVSITVHPAKTKQFGLKIRVPNRSVSQLYTATPGSNGITSIAVNGKAVTPSIVKGYAVIERTWKTGDKVDLVLPMKVQRIKGIDKIAATRGQVAVRRGPLIYSVENADQDIEGVLPWEALLKSQWRGDFLGGVPVITGKWADGSPLTAIPYYVRANRNAAKSEDGKADKTPLRSTVWIKDE